MRSLARNWERFQGRTGSQPSGNHQGPEGQQSLGRAFQGRAAGGQGWDGAGARGSPGQGTGPGVPPQPPQSVALPRHGMGHFSSFLLFLSQAEVLPTGNVSRAVEREAPGPAWAGSSSWRLCRAYKRPFCGQEQALSPSPATGWQLSPSPGFRSEPGDHSEPWNRSQGEALAVCLQGLLTPQALPVPGTVEGGGTRTQEHGRVALGSHSLGLHQLKLQALLQRTPSGVTQAQNPRIIGVGKDLQDH